MSFCGDPLEGKVMTIGAHSTAARSRSKRLSIVWRRNGVVGAARPFAPSLPGFSPRIFMGIILTLFKNNLDIIAFYLPSLWHDNDRANAYSI